MLVPLTRHQRLPLIGNKLGHGCRRDLERPRRYPRDDAAGNHHADRVGKRANQAADEANDVRCHVRGQLGRFLSCWVYIPAMKMYRRPMISDHLPDSVNKTVAAVRWAMGIHEAMVELSASGKCQQTCSVQQNGGGLTECRLVLSNEA